MTPRNPGDHRDAGFPPAPARPPPADPAGRVVFQGRRAGGVALPGASDGLSGVRLGSKISQEILDIDFASF
jgi:hypothetical protein